MGWRDNMQEVRELGLEGTLHRGWWELKQRSGVARIAPVVPAWTPARSFDVRALPWASATSVAPLLKTLVPEAERARLVTLATRARSGKILCFGRWEGDYGDPIDWHRNPTNGKRWSPSVHHSLAMRDGDRVGDVKLTWEAGRFPQAFHLARAAVVSPEHADDFARGFVSMVRGFLAANPFPFGVHWSSNQECAIRLNAWLFALKVFSDLGVATDELEALAREVTAYAWRVGSHTEHEIAYAERAVYNNHLITEAFGLVLAATLCPDAPEASRWRARGISILTEQADAQVYPDGAYINLAHNYHRVILQEYLLAARVVGGEMPAAWRAAMTRSLDFLVAHQNPLDGSLPNYGANDGSLPRVLSTCDFRDFRPTLQAASLALRGERIYPVGPWDEEALWSLGPTALVALLRAPARRSVSFARTGFHVLRAHREGSFGAFRCGTIRDRFGQIDMLHLDVFFRGHNVLVDGGTFLYNAETAWHDHFLQTASHNTVTVDGRDQMLHHRRFKYLYWTEADVLRWESGDDSDLVVGEHRGYARHPGGCVHRRAVLRVGERWVVVDTVTGTGRHNARLHWLGGTFAHRSTEGTRMTLATPDGDFEVVVLGEGLRADVVRGSETPPRGFVSRYYGHREASPSLAAEVTFTGSVELVSLLGPGPMVFTRQGNQYAIEGCGVVTVRDGIPVLA